MSPDVYRRRRLVVGSVVAAVTAVIIGLSLGSAVIADQPGIGNDAPRAIVVQQGDTLWEIARRITPTGNISGLVNELVRLNGADLQVGQIVRIP